MALNTFRIGLLPLVVLTLATGCEDSSGSGASSELEDTVDAAAELLEQASEVLSGVCDCWEAFGFASQEACNMSQEVEDTSFDRDCLVEALSMDPEAAIENYTCEQSAVEELVSCISTALDACDADAFTSCISVPEPNCAELPPEVEMAADACLGS